MHASSEDRVRRPRRLPMAALLVGFTTQAGELWLIDADGRHPRLIATGAGPVDWRP